MTRGGTYFFGGSSLLFHYFLHFLLIFILLGVFVFGVDFLVRVTGCTEGKERKNNRLSHLLAYSLVTLYHSHSHTPVLITHFTSSRKVRCSYLGGCFLYWCLLWGYFWCGFSCVCLEGNLGLIIRRIVWVCTETCTLFGHTSDDIFILMNIRFFFLSSNLTLSDLTIRSCVFWSWCIKLTSSLKRQSTPPHSAHSRYYL